jgi:hypothetical protein
MNKLAKTFAAAGAFVAATVTQASASTMFALMGSASKNGRHGHGHGHGQSGGSAGGASGGAGGGGAPSAPEIDVSQGAAALVIAAIAFLLIRELYLRQRQTA